MSLRKTYLDYLDHFGQTVPVRELWSHPEAPDLIGLRHDVDHSLDMALEMSYWEHRRGARATYFLLPDADYWQDARLVDKCLQIQDFGHEIGLHVNVITEWAKGLVDDPAQRLADALDPLRTAGVDIIGTAAHGDRMCYARQYINYWLFRELRPKDPAAAESGRSAEGIPAIDDQTRINYPDSHILTRDDGRVLPLWSVSMKQLGLDYHAVHVPHDRYFTDSGGQWNRSPDPLGVDLSRGRHQVLMHPEYWKGRQKIFFFLSAARSGSKWLATLLDGATPLTARHEFSLNHRYVHGEWVREHITGPGFTRLEEDQDRARGLLLDIRAWVEAHGQDYAEANVYLERFLPQLQEVFPDAVLVHLHRHPADVVRSIINRGWYDTPEDDRHPITRMEGWEKLSQFAKACWYVRTTNENLMPLETKIRFEEIISDPSSLERRLGALGIPFYPRLAAEIFSRRINANPENDFPEFEVWPKSLRLIVGKICGTLFQSLGYDGPDQNLMIDTPKLSQGYDYDFLTIPVESSNSQLLAEMDFTIGDYLSEITHKFCDLHQTPYGLEVTPAAGRHSYILLGGGEWDRITDGAAWMPLPAHYFKGTIQAEVTGAGSVRLFCLMYDRDGNLSDKKLLQNLKLGQQEWAFSFRVKANAAVFNLALHMSKDDLPQKLVLKIFKMQTYKFDFYHDK